MRNARKSPGNGNSIRVRIQIEASKSRDRNRREIAVSRPLLGSGSKIDVRVGAAVLERAEDQLVGDCSGDIGWIALRTR
jgi:hypothetical protein